MLSRIPSQNVPLSGLKDGLIAIPWFRFLQSLSNVVNVVTETLDFPSTAAQTSSDLTVTVPGAVEGDDARVVVPGVSMLASSWYNAWVSAPGIVTVRFNNYSTAAQDPASGDFKVIVERY